MESSSKKQQNLTRREFALLLGGSGVAISLTGCGGGSGKSSATSGKGTGKVRLRIVWPPKNRATPPHRYIPSYAQSIVLNLIHKTQPGVRYDMTLNRPSDGSTTQTVLFNQEIRVGTYVLNATAQQELDGKGTTVAAASSQVVVTFNQTADANLTMSSTISTVKVLGQPIKLPMGQHITLSGQALDRDGYVLVLVGGALQWTLVSGNAFADLMPDGVLTGKTPGTARVRLSESGAGISDEADVQIIATTLSLANSGWAKFRGGIGNGAVGAGSGATNNIKWNTTLAATSADAIHMVIGADGTLYVPDNTTGALTAYDSAGAQKWTTAGVSANSGVVIASDGTAIVTSPNRKLQTLDSATQAVKWTFNDAGSSNYSGPTLAPNGLIYMVADNTLYAISSDSGALAWKYVADAALVPSTPCVGPDGTVFISTNASVQAVSAGQLVWRAALESGVGVPIAMPVLSSDGSTLFISGLFSGSSYSLYALSSSSGGFLWKYAGNNWFGSAPAVAPVENVVYYVNGYFSSGIIGFNGAYSVYAFDGATGNQKWRLSGGFVRTSDPIVAADGIIYYGYDYNPGGTFTYPAPAALIAVRPTDGSTQWAYISPNGGYASVYPSAVGPDGTLYAASNGSLLAFK